MSEVDNKLHRICFVVLSGPMTGHQFILQTNQPILIGRGDQAVMRLDDGHVSAKHARIIWRQGQVLLEDLCSRNGTKVSGQAVELAVHLREGDIIALGRTELKYEGLISEDKKAADKDQD